MLVPRSNMLSKASVPVECAQAIVFIRHESRYLIVPDSKMHHGVSEGRKDAEGSLTAWVRECSLNFELISL
jgi:hypothetical protein